MSGLVRDTSAVRLFVAIELPEQVKNNIIQLQKELQRSNLFKGTYPVNDAIHLTLKFIGTVSVSELDAIDGALQKISFTSFTIKTGSVDVFRRRDRIAVIYLHCIAPALTLLVKKIETVLVQWVETEKRPYVGHVTIARVKEVMDQTALLKVVNKLVVPTAVFTVTSFVLKKSLLVQQGAQHEVVRSYVLK